MKSFAVLLSLATAIIANPLPQAIDASIVQAATVPSVKYVPIGGSSERTLYDPKAVADATYNNVFKSHAASKRSLNIRTQPGACGPLPLGSGPTPDSDTDTAFSSYNGFSSTALGAPTPSEYVTAYQDLDGSSALPMGYLGFDSLSSYDPNICASKCNDISGCIAFNIFFERDPALAPAENCTNPPSTTYIKCSYWGAPVGPDTAINKGQYRQEFHVVIAGSNGYNAQNVNNVPGYSGTYLNNAAINAPSDCNSYITAKFFDDGQPFDPSRCAAACMAETDYNAQYLNSRAVCRFFDTYVLSKNGVPQGQYCALYTASWDASYATNTGYTSGLDEYTISYSYSYSNTIDPKLNSCSCGIGSICNTGIKTTTSVSTVVTSTIVSVSTSASSTATTPVITTTATTAVTTSTSLTSLKTTTLSTTTRTTTTLSATPTPKGPCFRVRIKGSSYCNNAYISLDPTGVLSWSITATTGTTFYLDSSTFIRTKDGKYGKCPNVKTSKENGAITFGTSTDPDAVTCSTTGSDVSCNVQGTTVTSLWTSKNSGNLIMGSQPTSGQWDKVGIKVEAASCSA